MLISSKIVNFTKNALLYNRNIQSPKSISKFVRFKGQFAAAMTEALNAVEQKAELKKSERDASEKIVKETKEMKRNLKRRKWVDWKTQDDEAEAGGVKRAPFDPADRIKRKKTVILLAYSGANYFGMQRNPGMQTIEEELFKAMLKHKWITEDSFEQAQISCFQRAARTDKGVSAARQVCSIKLPDELDIKAFNADLPEQIRLFGAQRVTKGFNAKDQCNARTYTYTLPTIAFANVGNEKEATDAATLSPSSDVQSFRIDQTQLGKIREVLEMYEGTKNFHNFTSRKNFLDPSAKRFIMSFTNTEPFITPQGIEFITLKVKGQSFMLHQIRKMVGLAIAIVRGNTTAATLERALTEERLDLPMAPGLGLVLDTVHYERYNERYGNDGIHEPLTWEKQDAEIREFIEQHINANIYRTEHEESSMVQWLATLPLHSYDARRDEVNASADSNDKKNVDNKDDDGEE